MFLATDTVTDLLVAAEVASRSRIYRCPICNARVRLKVRQQTSYFAHFQGEALPECENYFPPPIRYLRRPPHPFAGDSANRGIRESYLAFSMAEDGPHLGLWLPPPIALGWSGSVLIEAHETSRKLSIGDLVKGRRIDFPLVNGQWNVTTEGVVDESYLTQLSLGRQSLEFAGTLFNASTSICRQILPGEGVVYGDSVYWVGREQLEPNVLGARLCNISQLAHSNGWYVHLVEIPLAIHSSEDYLELSQWLERRIKPKRPRTWINSPWPRRTSESGCSEYYVGDGPLVIRADRPVDLSIEEMRSSRVLFQSNEAERVEWCPPGPGAFEILIDDVVAETIWVVDVPPRFGRSVSIALSENEPMDFAYAQHEVEALIDAGVGKVQASLDWGSPELAGIIKLRHPLMRVGLSKGVDVELGPGITIDFGNLGLLRWPATEPVPVSRENPKQEAQARWLLSVADRVFNPRGERLLIDGRFLGDSLVHHLLHCSWTRVFAPQVRIFSRKLSAEK